MSGVDHPHGQVAHTFTIEIRSVWRSSRHCSRPADDRWRVVRPWRVSDELSLDVGDDVDAVARSAFIWDLRMEVELGFRWPVGRGSSVSYLHGSCYRRSYPRAMWSRHRIRIAEC